VLPGSPGGVAVPGSFRISSEVSVTHKIIIGINLIIFEQRDPVVLYPEFPGIDFVLTEIL
jgi:hypothetical protein